MLIGIVGKPNCGKTTFLNAACLTTAKVGDYPFTTIDPNPGTAYVCVGIKGMQQGEAIELVGATDQYYVGINAGEHLDLTFPEVPEPNISTEPGMHEGTVINGTEVVYYIPEHFDANTAEYFVGIHGARLAYARCAAPDNAISGNS